MIFDRAFKDNYRILAYLKIQTGVKAFGISDMHYKNRPSSNDVEALAGHASVV